MRKKIFGVLQRVGQSFMLPIALLPVAGLLLGIGSSFTNETMLQTYHLAGVIYPGSILYMVLDIMKSAGEVIFNNLPLLFAIGVAIGMARKEKATAALSGAIAFLVMHAAIGTMINFKGGVTAMPANATSSVLGITSLQMGVFGGIIVGLGVAVLHNRFYDIELPQAVSFFGGTRFVPIISCMVFIIVGVIMFFLWPIVQNGIASLGNLVIQLGYGGTFLYGLIERLLIPFGLHHVFYMPFWQTGLGGTAIIDGVQIMGAQNIFFVELASKSTKVFSVSATRFMSGKFPLMIFGLPAAALAMYQTARPEKKKLVLGLLFSAALTSFLTGITEPIEFTFLFIAPALYGIHCVFAGLSYMLMHLFNVGVGMTFSGGVIDLTLFGILQGNAKTNWIWVIIVGLGYAVVYFGLFYFAIKKFDLKTPGRTDEATQKLYTKADFEAKQRLKKVDMVSALILTGLGGKKNISDLDACATRLRVTVYDESAVREDDLKQSGAAGVIFEGNGLQIIYGPKVPVIKSRLEKFMDTAESDQLEDLFGAIELTNTISSDHKDTTPSESTAGDAAQPLTIMFYSPMKGQVISLESVSDTAFAHGTLGEGVAIEPSEGKLYAPCDGKILCVFPTKHAVCMVTDDGCELLLHIGFDTVKLEGQYFDAHVQNEQRVKKGDLLISFDQEKIRSCGFTLTTPMVITNSAQYCKIESIAKGSVAEGVELLSVEA